MLKRNPFMFGNRKQHSKEKRVKISDVHDNLHTRSENLCFQGYALHILTCLHGIITLPPLHDKDHNKFFWTTYVNFCACCCISKNLKNFPNLFALCTHVLAQFSYQFILEYSDIGSSVCHTSSSCTLYDIFTKLSSSSIVYLHVIPPFIP